MKRVKNFTEFLKESNIFPQDDMPQTEIPQGEMDDEFIQNEYPQDEFIPNREESEDEEKEEMVEITYNKTTDSWNVDRELDEPTDIDEFTEWFNSIDEEETTVSMTENDERDEVTFFIPEYLYVEYLEGVGGTKAPDYDVDNDTGEIIDYDNDDDIENIGGDLNFDNLDDDEDDI